MRVGKLFSQIFENVVEKLNFEITMSNRTQKNEQRRNKRKREVLEVAPNARKLKKVNQKKKSLTMSIACVSEDFFTNGYQRAVERTKFQPFFHAVDEEVVRDYYQVIKNPMDLDQIAENIDDCVYTYRAIFEGFEVDCIY